MIRRLVLALALCLVCTAPALAQGRIGIADLISLTARSAPGQQIERELESRFGNERKQLEALANDLNKKAEDLDRQAAALSDSARQTRVQELQRLAQDLDTKGSAYTKRLGEIQQKLTVQMQEILTQACAQYAQQNNFDLIVDSAAIMYASNAMDVTNGLIEAVNRVWQSRNSRFNL